MSRETRHNIRGKTIKKNELGGVSVEESAIKSTDTIEIRGDGEQIGEVVSATSDAILRCLVCRCVQPHPLKHSSIRY